MKKFLVTAIISGNTFNFDDVKEDGTITFEHHGNKRSTEKSILKQTKELCSFCGCKIEKIISIKEA